jgi:hypothetical protein
MIDSLAILLLSAVLQADGSPPGEPALSADSAVFSRYQLILDRKPFGNIASAAAAAAEADADPDQPPLSAILRLAVLEVDDETGAIKAGLIDASSKKNYYLTIGEEDDGIKLVDADFRGDRALVRKGTQEAWLTMGASTSAAAPASPTESGNEGGRRQRFRDMMQARLAQRSANPTAGPPPPPVPYMATNRPNFKSPKEMDEYYRKVNLDLIRAGGEKGPPLPIALTPEEDTLLVKEGVLPPQDAPAIP